MEGKKRKRETWQEQRKRAVAEAFASPENRSLIEILKGVRARSQLTQRQLAGRLKWSQAHIWKIENGLRGVDPVECAAWARACGITPRVFFNRFVDALERKV